MEQPSWDVWSSGKNWFKGTVNDGAQTMLAPVGEAIKDAFIYGLDALPMVLVVGGLFCFVGSIVLAHSKPYFYGIACWAASAIVTVMSHGITN